MRTNLFSHLGNDPSRNPYMACSTATSRSGSRQRLSCFRRRVGVGALSGFGKTFNPTGDVSTDDSWAGESSHQWTLRRAAITDFGRPVLCATGWDGSLIAECPGGTSKLRSKLQPEKGRPPKQGHQPAEQATTAGSDFGLVTAVRSRAGATSGATLRMAQSGGRATQAAGSGQCDRQAMRACDADIAPPDATRTSSPLRLRQIT